MRKDIPLPDLCALGGWKDAKTILKCYQTPDRDTMGSPWPIGDLRVSPSVPPPSVGGL